MNLQSERKHSKFSASGSERWFNCQGSVPLSEGLPDKDTIYSKEGTKAHGVLEEIMFAATAIGAKKVGHVTFPRDVPREMIIHGTNAANFILGVHAKAPMSEVLIETRIRLAFIHPEMFGTFDGAVVDHFGTLHVFDYKYGAGHSVSPIKNLQMIFYGLGLAHKYFWNFKRIRLWIIQPRVKGYDGPLFWELSIGELRKFVDIFKDAVARVENEPSKFKEGNWCWFCKAKSICPLKTETKVKKAKTVFTKIEKGN